SHHPLHREPRYGGVLLFQDGDESGLMPVSVSHRLGESRGAFVRDHVALVQAQPACDLESCCAAIAATVRITAAPMSGATVLALRASRAPVNAPTSIAATANKRRPSFAPAPPARVESAAMPVRVMVRTVVV